MALNCKGITGYNRLKKELGEMKQYQFIKDINNLPFVLEIWLFGSRARNDHHERSDIDLAIKLAENNQDFKRGISDIVAKADTLLKVDITYLNDPLDPEFLELINKDKILIEK